MKQRCLLCLNERPLTREHKIKRSLLEYFNNLQNNSENKTLMYDNGTDNGAEFTNIKKARVLKPKKNICHECNSKRSAECDSHFDQFVIDAFHWQENVPELNSLVAPTNEEAQKEADHQRGNLVRPVPDNLWMDGTMLVNSKYLLSDKYVVHNVMYDENLIKKYLAKHTICYFDRAGVSSSPKLRDIFISGSNMDALQFEIYYLPRDFQYGYFNTMIKMPANERYYALVFSNLAIHVTVKRD